MINEGTWFGYSMVRKGKKSGSESEGVLVLATVPGLRSAGRGGGSEAAESGGVACPYQRGGRHPPTSDHGWDPDRGKIKTLKGWRL